MAFDTAGNIVNRAAKEIGLPTSTDPFASTDDIHVQMCALLTSCGQDLVDLRDWTHLRKEYTFTTVGGTDSYALPADFNGMYDQTWWNRTNQLPLGGPLSAQEWQYLKARSLGVVFTVLFRKMTQQIVIYPDGANTPGGYNIAFEYGSSYWVSTAAAPTVLASDTPTVSTNVLWFDPLLLVRFLKTKVRAAHGLDNAVEHAEFEQTLARVMNGDAPAPVLSLNGALRYGDIEWLG